MPLRRDSPPRPRKEASHAAGAAASHTLGRRRVTSLFGGESRPRAAAAATRRSSGPFAGGGRASRGGRDVLTQPEPPVTHIDPSRSGEGLRAPAGGPATRPAYRQRPQFPPSSHVPVFTKTYPNRRRPAGRCFPPFFVTLSCPPLVPDTSLSAASPHHARACAR